ncbi:unnamed protein product [Pieris macdunnoughi]|uniref:Uncharacterized protein n=1 Tax=Pieris macdunnoughi TaxID=345717 RepID=A0A821W2J4_9NEOP|nr:unnamed protein product [Pieris macdunnoughi]
MQLLHLCERSAIDDTVRSLRMLVLPWTPGRGEWVLHSLSYLPWQQGGVFQTLVDKHFPAPDRERINRLLGLEPKKAPLITLPAVTNGKNGVDDDANTSKRKLTSRQQANMAAKRARGGSSSDKFFRGSEDELELEPDSDEERRVSDSDLSDTNPFQFKPWVNRKKKQTKKKKVAAKKKNTTQDKIETMFEKKNTTPTVTVKTNSGQSLTGTPVGTNGLYLGN